MKTLTIALAASSALAGCTQTTAPDLAPATAAATATASATAEPLPEGAAALGDAPAGEAELGTYGFDTSGMDRSVDPGDDFYAYANGRWAAATAIPADKSNYGMFGALDDLSRERTKAIILEAAADPANRVGAAYNSFLDTDRIEALGMAPIAPLLADIAAIDSVEDYATMLGRADRLGFGGGPIGWYIGQDDGDSTRYIMNAYQSGLGLPDRDYYLEDSERFVTVRAAYVDYLADLLGHAGVASDEARARAEAILAFETALAKVHWDRNALGDSEKTYNLGSRAELEALAPGFAWDAMWAAGGYDFDEINVMTPSAIEAGMALAAAAELDVLKDKLAVAALRSFAPALPAAVDGRVFDFYSRTLSGVPEQEERWKRGVQFVSRALRDDVGQVYAARHFPPEHKAAMQELVDNVIAAMRQRITTADWMAEATKRQAIDKLERFTVKIGYPDRWESYEGLTMQPDDLFRNMLRAREWQHQDALAKLDEPLRRWEWGMAPMTVNAYANFGQMEIVFPASILQPPFFDPNADPAINYGGIGAVIGHEISHHFDDQGAKYDSSGNLNNWWTEADYANFEARGKALIDQYGAYEIFPGEYIDGEFTLGENIGDLAGLAIAHDAYRASLNGEDAPVIDGTTGDQRFFLGWAQVWRRNYRDEELKRRLKTDSHSPSIQRVWVIRNMDAWYDAFAVDAADAMYLAPAQRVTVW
ncbi:M13 family metallopeptidase [Sphingomicrobium astaxanthinifaciens]|uniref:M13 family metallopeptidase n=1 Tax=Sphingomicrobium astaxanthinifaciens TaxID=1227949 RepID=UPI001FCCA0C2|nr:M13 family metallopeptidase [Sphingomicrobium astaxanthinifaciens]MCJ7422236.1 M13 family metallopeptidase [Sphingomicrobium astaxanthinifaciens]